MPQRDDFSPERLDELIDGPPATAGDDGFSDLISELRAAEGASPELQARVRTIVDPPKPVAVAGRLSRWLRGTSWTQRAMAFAPACVLLLGAVFTVSSITDGTPSADETPKELAAEQAPETKAAPPPTAASPSASDSVAGQAGLSEASLTIRVAGPDAIAAAGRRAASIAVERGGRRLSETYTETDGQPRTAVVTIEVPAGRYDDVRTALAKIGPISKESTSFREVERNSARPGDEGRLAAPGAPATITVTITTR